MKYGDIFSFNDNLFVIWLDGKNEDYIKIFEKKQLLFRFIFID